MTQHELLHFQRLNAELLPVGEVVKAQFNPTEISFEKGVQIAEIPVPGLDMPLLQFVRGQTETLSLELFFDTTDHGTAGSDVVAVTTKTNPFYQLLKIDRETHAPPVLGVTWGAGEFPASSYDGSSSGRSEHGFQCVVESVQQRFTLFSPEGVPLRATLSVKLKEYKTLAQQVREIRHASPDRTRARVVGRGETLSAIAQHAYGDPRKWRPIAEHNGITDPLTLSPGQVLEIPPTE
jgi:hypothetical protein